jgi:hypothetical protein
MRERERGGEIDLKKRINEGKERWVGSIKQEETGDESDEERS